MTIPSIPPSFSAQAEYALSSMKSSQYINTVQKYRQNNDKMVEPYDVSAGQTPLLHILNQKEGRNQAELVEVLAKVDRFYGTMDKKAYVVCRCYR